MSKFSYAAKAKEQKAKPATTPTDMTKSTTVYSGPATKVDVEDQPTSEPPFQPTTKKEQALERPVTSAPKEEPKKLTTVEILVEALKGHGHVFSVEEKKALGKDDPELKVAEEAKAELRRAGVSEDDPRLSEKKVKDETVEE